MNYSYLETPIGTLLIAGDKVLRKIQFPNKSFHVQEGWKQSESGIVGETIRQLKQYFAGKRTDFELPVEPAGTVFQKKVWRALQDIPYGKTISYGELAKWIGNAQASRAVGAANGQNPIPIVIPCHRVIGANGKLTGFGGGLPTKETLLAIEARQRSLLSTTAT